MTVHARIENAPLPSNQGAFADVLARSDRMGPGIPIEALAALNEIDAHTADELGHIDSPFSLSHRGHADAARLPAPTPARDPDFSTEMALSKLKRVLSHAAYEPEAPTQRALEVLGRLTAVLEGHVMLRDEAQAVVDGDWR